MRVTLKKSTIRALQGLILAFGSPLGWLTIQYLIGVSITAELETNSGVYLYMLFGTMIVFTLFGYYVGEKEDNSEMLSFRDPLTGVFNVRYFRERLKEEIIEAHRDNTPLTLIYFDLDHFKNVNDKYGHAVGDEALVTVCHAASKVLRKHEILARVGGEEFVGLLPRCSLEDGLHTAERLIKKVSATPIAINANNQFFITVSAGVATLAEEDDDNTLYTKADSGLYKAKNNGRNRVELA
ncbi:GGDEF domain-containing protein [Thalassotalea fusca]